MAKINWKEIKSKPWFQTLAKIAPMIGTAIGGPYGAVAGGILLKALGLPETASIDDLAAKVENASASDVLAMRQADNDFKVKMRELDISEQDLYLKDTQSARSMQVETRSKMPATLAILGWLQWVIVLVVILFGDSFGIEFENDQRDILFFVLATAQAMALQGFYFYLGSSRGSKEKTAAFERFMLDGGKPIN